MRLRLRIAEALDRRFPMSCWVDFYDWSHREKSLREAVRGNPLCTVSPRSGACWCGKKRAPVVEDDGRDVPGWYCGHVGCETVGPHAHASGTEPGQAAS